MKTIYLDNVDKSASNDFDDYYMIIRIIVEYLEICSYMNLENKINYFNIPNYYLYHCLREQHSFSLKGLKNFTNLYVSSQ